MRPVCDKLVAPHRLLNSIMATTPPRPDPDALLAMVAEGNSMEPDFRAATHRVFRTPDKPSSLDVTIVRGTLPR